MWQIVVAATWIILGAYLAWYIAAAKDYVQITGEELQFLWRVHKDRSGCKARSCKGVSRGSKIVGFECECGYRHVQKRLITLRSPAKKHESLKVYDKILVT